MARNFRRQRAAHPIAELNITNLVDLGFMLLVIFMIATPLIQNEQSMRITLPETVTVPPSSQTKEEFAIVGVDAGGRFYVGEKADPVTLTELQSQLRMHAQKPKPPVMRIQGDAKTHYEKVAQLMAEVMKAGLTRVSIDTLAKE